MRPRRKVLLYCADAVAGEQMGWLLGLRCTPGVVVTVAPTPQEFLWHALERLFDCVVVYRSAQGEKTAEAAPVCADEQVCQLLRAADSVAVMVELSDGLPVREYSCAHKLVPGTVKASMAEVLEAVSMACARKRGPICEKDRRRGFSLNKFPVDRMVA